jgi:hypothetical protein
MVTDIEEAIKPVAERYGVEMKMGNTKYRDNGADFRIAAAVINEPGQAMNRDYENFIIYCNDYGLEVSDFGRLIEINGKTCQINGISPKSTKCPILAIRIKDEAQFRFTEKSVRAAIEKAKARENSAG